MAARPGRISPRQRHPSGPSGGPHPPGCPCCSSGSSAAGRWPPRVSPRTVRTRRREHLLAGELEAVRLARVPHGGRDQLVLGSLVRPAAFALDDQDHGSLLWPEPPPASWERG